MPFGLEVSLPQVMGHLMGCKGCAFWDCTAYYGVLREGTKGEGGI